jgi:hypothetical protein
VAPFGLLHDEASSTANGTSQTRSRACRLQCVHLTPPAGGAGVRDASG